VEHDIPTGLLDVANAQVNRVVEELRRIAASGRLITIEDIAMMLWRLSSRTSTASVTCWRCCWP